MFRFRVPRFPLVLALFVLLVTGSRPACAQTDSAEVSGRITDPSGALVRDAVVELRSVARDTVQSTASNQNGIYVFAFVRPGKYSISVTRNGFHRVDLLNLTLNTQDHIEQNFILPIGASSESVTVSADGRVDTSPSVSTSVDQNFVKDMPLNGRDFRSLIAITPGAARTGGVGLFSFNGQRDNTNYFTVDGVAANAGISQTQGAALGQAGAGQAPELSALGTTSSLLSLDALDQIKIQSANYMPEYGRSAGGQIQLTSRGGTDVLHGSLYDFVRNDAMDAMNSYTKYENVALSAKLPKPPLQMNDFGGSLGGPVRIPHLYNGAKRTFFFVSYEGLRLDQPTSGSAEEAPENVRNTANIYPTLLPFVAIAPLPNGVDQYGIPALFASYSNPSSTNNSSLRIDETVSDRLTLFGRYAYSPSYSSVRSIYSINELDTTHSGNNTLTLGSTFLIHQHLANELRANWTKSDGTLVSTLDAFDGGTAPTSAMNAQMMPSQYGATASNSMFVFGAYPGPWTESYQYGMATANTQRQINVVDGLSWVKGSHGLKFGADWRYLFPIAAPTVYSQNVAYYDPADLLSGTATVGQIQSADTLVIHQQDLGLYAQDTWHLTPNLTLNYGLRWDYDPAPQAANGQSLYVVVNPLDPSNAKLSSPGGQMYPSNLTQFAPRVGAAYQLTSAQGYETLIKAGYGLFYVPSADTALQATTYFPHDRYTAIMGNSWLTNPAPPVSVTSGPPYTNQLLLAYQPGFTTPRTQEWNVSVQQNLGSQQSFTLAYVGSAGRKLTRLAQFSGGNYKNLFLDLNEYYSADTSDYNSLQASFVRNMRHGLQMLANYVWSKSLDTSSGDTVISTSPTAFSVSGERGPSDFDIRDTANITFDWELPKVAITSKVLSTVVNGWGMDGIFSANSGKPLTVTMQYALPSTGTTRLRPDITGAPIWISAPSHFGGKKLNPSAFSTQWATSGSKTQGNEGRNSIHGLGFNEVDYTVRRQFKFGERFGLQYRCDFFNLLNQTNYAAPNTLLGSVYNKKFTVSPTFGTIANTYSSSSSAGGFFGVGGARKVQMALRLSF